MTINGLWLYNHIVKARPVFQEKRLVPSSASEVAAVVEIKIWDVPKSKDYPSGRKFSLFLVAEGKVVVGFDNHKPKGPHLHLGNRELPYLYRNNERLISDFWDLVRKAGFEP
ncbi:MAG: DUF6516 family protein [Bdellovibrionota bacterium]